MQHREAWRRPARAQARQNRTHNLPAPLTRLLGRAAQLVAVRRALLEPHVRLLTLVGPPGIGKTRLGLEVAAELLDEFAQGACFVPLAPLRDSELVAPAIAQALEIREVGGRPLQETLLAALRSRVLLLALDNLEHLLAAAPLVADLLERCPGLKVLATSRAPLHVYGEHEFPVPPLALPDPGQSTDLQALGEVPAVALLLERARAVRPDFALTAQNAAVVAEVSVRLDGLPLAIELAAARMKLLPPQAILSRLGSRLDLLSGGALGRPERHQTLRAAVAWSHDLFSVEEQRLLRRLAVFAGGCTLEAAGAVCAFGAGAGGWGSGSGAESRMGSPIPIPQPPTPVLEGLAALVDKSLVQETEQPNGEPRFWMLETIRDYALEQLEASGEANAVRRQHATFFVNLAEEADPKLAGPEQLIRLGRLEAEHDNLRAALAWSLAAGGTGADLGLRLAGALHWFWLHHGHLSEGRRWLEAALAHAEPAGRTAARARALLALVMVANTHADYGAARSAGERSVGIWRALGEKAMLGRSLTWLGTAAMFQGDLAAARAFHEESVAVLRETGDRWGLALAVNQLGASTRRLGEMASSRSLREQGLAFFRETGDRWGLALALTTWANDRLQDGDHDGAAALYRQALAPNLELGDTFSVCRCLNGLAGAACLQGSHRRAARLLGAVEALLETVAARLLPPDLALFERTRADVRARLGEASFTSAWAEGRAMSLEEIVHHALGPTGRSAGQVAEPAPSTVARPPDPLTAREREVAALIARGFINRQIAAELVISERTAEKHVANILGKLGFASRAQIATWAVEAGSFLSSPA